MKSIRLHLGLMAVAIAVAAAGGVSLVTYFSVQRLLYREFDKVLVTEARALAAMVELNDGKLEMEWTPEAFPQFRASSTRGYFVLLDESGARLFQSANLERSDARLPAAAPGRIKDVELPQDEDGRLITLAVTPIVEKPTQGPATTQSGLSLVVAEDTGDVEHTLDLLAAVLAITTVVFALLSGALASVGVSLGLSSLGRLSEWAAAVDERNLQLRLSQTNWPTELAPIVGRLNDLMDRLQKSFDDERRFSGNLSHELRTPLAELTSLADVANRWPDDAAARQQLLVGSKEIATRMTMLVNAIISVTRLNGGQPLAMEEVDCAALVRTILERYRQQFDDRGVSVQTEISKRTLIRSNPAILEQIIENVISNAASHADANSLCRIKFCAQPAPTLEVTNRASQLVASDLPQLRQPLWRKDEARTESHHLGMGLYLVHRYLDALAGELTFSLRDGELTTTISFSAPSHQPPTGSTTTI